MEAAAPPTPLPLLPDINPGVRRFLDARFRSADDLATAADVEAEICGRCAELEALVSDLSVRIDEASAAYSSCREAAGSALSGVRDGLCALKAFISTGVDEEVVVGTEQMQFEQLPALASEVARVEMIREYAGSTIDWTIKLGILEETELIHDVETDRLSYTEMALKLDSLVGDVEDAVSSSVTGKLKSLGDNSEKTHVAIGYLKNIEDLLASVTTTRPHWIRLLSAVDQRVDRSLAILRPQAIVDHRALLSSLGWPPSLAGSKFSSIDSGKQAEIVNPLFSMSGDLKSKYSESFLSLCNLQELQKRRKTRQLKGHNVGNQLRQPLWVIEELVNPISSTAQHHFSKWAEKPEFVFALAYKIIRDFVDSMDEILQPLVDKAKLIGYSCREEWISGMVIALSTYLAKEIFPKQIELLQESSSSDAGSTPYQARVSWLSLVDLMISFDKRTQDLISSTGLLLTLKDDDNWQRISVLSVFCDRPDWLEVWAEIERQEILDKLKSGMESEKNWSTRIEGTMLEYGSDDYKSPAITTAVHQSLSLLIDRARPIPSITLRAEFIRMSASPIILEFLGYMLRRCQEAEGLTALVDDNALLKVSQSINAARYFESTLTEWCQDVFFLEMEILSVNGEGGCIFQQEINHLKEFRVEWVDKITTVILRAFDSRSRDYLKNKRQWLEKSEGPAVSRAFIESLDYMQGQLSKLEGGLNALDFVTVWRGIANGVDQLLFGGIFTGSAKISSGGVERLQGDLSVLFAVFSSWCLRPEGFFPRLSEGLRLLKVDEQQLIDGVFTDKNWLREYGIRHLTASDAEKIIKNRVYEA
ncbi:RINT1-like protein MAG2 [Dichanthelium oligosanthes]|uniref:RINT1-like protein MAG2 n=1 Tax=Dichanthelium oligosanthes TaxID=888268 RepID=A0A1E5UX14_9POAL|nr:RINT1-like protein MAG2 [Dichanthelium oligosanthes]